MDHGEWRMGNGVKRESRVEICEWSIHDSRFSILVYLPRIGGVDSRLFADG